jgi:sialate O-acetylesterase
MAVAIDIGEGMNIHPKNKQDVGRRLAAWALAKEYGQKQTFSGPIFKSCVIEGNKARIFFEHTDKGLVAGEKTGVAEFKERPAARLKGFAIAGTDKKWHWAEAYIDGNTVVAFSEKVSSPIAVRYAYSMNPQGANLYNKAGFPASPFKTEKR